MNILLMTLNSKFIHSNLALLSIKKYVEHYSATWEKPISMTMKEFTINNDLDSILWEIYEGHYTHIFVSTYIWNIEPLSILFSNYSQLNHKSEIFFGGPEVSFNPQEQLEKNEFLKGVILGEGEETLLELLKNIQEKGEVKAIPGLMIREGENFISAGPRQLIEPLDRIPFAYDSALLETLENKILYYESTRGCPFQCSYCLSSSIKKVRFLSLDRVYEDLDFFLLHKVPQVKFVDRTFNLKKEHALAIMRYLIENDNGLTNFHFETTATLLDESYFEILKNARKDLFQFEIGVQTTHIPTMEAICRTMPFDTLKSNTQKLIELGNAHVHVDLIAGLPFESYERFLKSFDDVMKIGAHHVQLGFLKILKGTAIDDQVDQYQYLVRREAPYEVLQNKWMSYEELQKLKKIDLLLEKFHNSGKFKQTMRFLVEKFQENYAELYTAFLDQATRSDFFTSSVSTYRQYEYMLKWLVNWNIPQDFASDLLKVDYYASKLTGQKLIFNYDDDQTFNQKRQKLLKNSEWFIRMKPHYQNSPLKEILKNSIFLSMEYDIMALIHSGYKNVIKEKHILMIDFYDQEERFLKIPLSTWEE